MTKVDISRFDYENLKLDNRRLINDKSQLSHAHVELQSNYKRLVKHQLQLLRCIDSLTQENFEYQAKILELNKRIENLEYELSCESHEKDLKGYDGYQWG